MKFQVEIATGHNEKMMDFAYLDSALHKNLDVDPYLAQQYIEAAQIIADLHEHLISIDDGTRHQLEKLPAVSTEEDNAIADLYNFINEFTDNLPAPIGDRSADLGFITVSTDILGAAIDTLCEGVDETEQLLMPDRFDDRDK